MIETKLFEIRDEGTFIPVMATRADVLSIGEHESYCAEQFLIERAGFGKEGHRARKLVVMTSMNSWQSHYDVYSWEGRGRTMRHAHTYITEHWDLLLSGAVIDVEFILGEKMSIKKSERFGL